MINVTKPLGDKLLVERLAKKEKTNFGIILPNDVIDDNTHRGKVLSVSDGTFNDKTGQIEPLDVKVGDIVLFHGKAGFSMKERVDDPDYVLLREEDVLAVVSED